MCIVGSGCESTFLSTCLVVAIFCWLMCCGCWCGILGLCACVLVVALFPFWACCSVCESMVNCCFVVSCVGFFVRALG